METAETNLELPTKKKVFFMSSNVFVLEAEVAVLEVM
jgi:hypothetical protein